MTGPAVARTARRIAVASFLVFALSGGGRVVGSDEVTMLELSRALLRATLEVPPGATMLGPDLRPYTKNAAGQAVLALPLVAAAETVAGALDLPRDRRTLAVRFVVSFFNAAVTAVLLAVFYVACRGFGITTPSSLAATVLLGFTTPLWAYAKSFMAEPLQALGLLLALVGSARAATGRWLWAAAAGTVIAVSVKLSMTPFVILCLAPLRAQPPRRALPVLIAFGAALMGHALYNLARFGTPFETGYGAQATPAAYSTPIWVGLYGLLISSGKGVLWFAPALWVAPWAWKETIGTTLSRPWRGTRTMVEIEPARRAAIVSLVVWMLALALYGSFEHWAGDGSFGPRYLVPFIPLAMIVVALVLDGASHMRRLMVVLLGVVGLLVQIGGVGIYYGAQMREAGDYPYRLPLGHPQFLSDSHFNPAFSPILGHWRMLARNSVEHLAQRAPRLSGGGDVDPRLGVDAADRDRLLRAIDLWWLYAWYAGVPLMPVLAAVLALFAATVWAMQWVWRGGAAEARAP